MSNGAKGKHLSKANSSSLNAKLELLITKAAIKGRSSRKKKKKIVWGRRPSSPYKILKVSLFIKEEKDTF